MFVLIFISNKFKSQRINKTTLLFKVLNSLNALSATPASKPSAEVDDLVTEFNSLLNKGLYQNPFYKVLNSFFLFSASPLTFPHFKGIIFVDKTSIAFSIKSK